MIKLVAVIIVVLLLVGAVVGGVSYYPKAGNMTGFMSAPGANPDVFFDSQTASLSGKITKLNDGKITIENSRGQTREFKTSENLTVYDPAVAPNAVSKPDDKTPGASQPKPEVGRQVTINLQVMDGEYVITGLSYIPEITSSPQPAATPDVNYEEQRDKTNPQQITKPASPSATAQ